MKRQFLLTLLFVCICLNHLFGQSIKFDLSAHKGKTIYLIDNKAAKRDTIFIGQINEKGESIFIPGNDRPLLPGLLTLHIDANIEFDFIYSPTENSTLHSEEEIINVKNSHFHNSRENDFMMNIFPELKQRVEKIMFCEQGAKIFDKSENFYEKLKEEKAKLEKQQVDFEAMLQNESTRFYSARFLLIQILMNNYIGRLNTTEDSEELARIKDYAISNIDTEALYSSGAWYYFFNGLLDFYDKEAPFFGQFGDDISKLMQKTKSQEVFLALAHDASSICSHFGWNADEITLSKYLLKSGRVTNPQGNLKQMILLNKLASGNQAPKIAVKEKQYIDFKKNKTLAIFYESGCSSCDTEINQLIVSYSALKEKGIEVVSIDANRNKSAFENSSKNFPWSVKLCDFKGFEGENFNNYAIMTTPTYFLIDNAGVILGKYSRLNEILDI